MTLKKNCIILYHFQIRVLKCTKNHSKLSVFLIIQKHETINHISGIGSVAHCLNECVREC